MKRNTAIILLLVFCVILTACSYSSQFVVINKSDSPIDIEYIIDTDLDSLEHTGDKPYKMALAKWDSRFGEKEWQEISQNEYEFDPNIKKCKIKLFPNEVLRFHTEHSRSNEEYEYFRFVNLRISGKNGQIIFQGNQFYKQFDKEDDFVYIATYK